MYEFAENIQRGIIYLLKSDDDFYCQIVNLVKGEYFEFPVHENIFSTITDYHEKYRQLPSDDLILEDVKKKKRQSEDLSDYEDELIYINSLDTSTINNKDYYVDLIEDFAKREAMKNAIKDCLVLIKENRVEETEEVVRKALTISRSVDNGLNYFPSVKERWERILNNDDTDKFRTPFTSLNRVLEGGLSAKELGMVVSPAGVGKSLFLVNQGVESLIEGRKVLYVSLEMSEDKIAQRFDSIMTLIPQSRLKSNQLTLHERLQVFQDEFPGSKLMIKEFPTGLANVNTLRVLLNQLKNFEDFTPDIIIVDYLELLRPTTEGMAEYQAQQRVAEELRGLGVENNCLIWTATQTNRQGRTVNIITDAELADAYGKIRTCDFAISLNQTEEEFDNGRMRVYVMKSRNSRQRFIVPAIVDYNILRMSESTEEFEDSEEG
jgi:replicative DNA helicase